MTASQCLASDMSESPTDHRGTIAALNRLLRLLHRSLPTYLEGARPWASRERRKPSEVLARIAQDHRHYAQRLAEAIIQQDGLLEPGQFPIEFAGIHDCSAEFLARKTLELQYRDLEVIRHCVEALSGVPHLRALAEEIHGNARGHIENLEQALA